MPQTVHEVVDAPVPLTRSGKGVGAVVQDVHLPQDLPAQLGAIVPVPMTKAELVHVPKIMQMSLFSGALFCDQIRATIRSGQQLDDFATAFVKWRKLAR